MNKLTDEQISWLKDQEIIKPNSIKFDANNFYQLSNFHYDCENLYIIDTDWPQTLLYDSVESAYQAAKSLTYDIRKGFCDLYPSDAKKMGKRLDIRSDWELVKYDYMFAYVQQKFQHKKYKKILKSTGDKQLIEWTYWGDRTWGTDLQGIGNNALGKILQIVREKI